MMQRNICTKFWTDAKVQQLTPTEKLIFLYLITNPHTHLSGLYYLPLSLASEELGVLPDWTSVWVNYTTHGMASYDPVQRLVWVRQMYGYQGRGESIERSVARHLESFHPSELITAFLKTYPQIKLLLSNKFREGVGEGGTPPLYPPVGGGSGTNTGSITGTGKIPRQEKSEKITDEEWLAAIRQNSAYQHINIDMEIGKMLAWLSLPKNKWRRRTKQFTINWLNKIESPMVGGVGKMRPPPPPDRNDPIARGAWKQLYGDPKVHGYE